jgi:hypothetical protein
MRLDNVICSPITRQRLSEHIPSRANARKNRTSITRQRNYKHASLNIEVVFPMGLVQSGYKKAFGSIEHQSSEVKSRALGRQPVGI